MPNNAKKSLEEVMLGLDLQEGLQAKPLVN